MEDSQDEHLYVNTSKELNGHFAVESEEHGYFSPVKLSEPGTGLLRAARAGNLDKVLEYLKANVDINTCNANGLNALHLASKDGHINVVQELLERGASVDAATRKGNTSLHIAALAGQEEVVRLLVQNGGNVNVQSQNGFTCLYMAAQENHDNVVKFLLTNGANQALATEDGFTPLAVAMQQGHDKVVALLLESDVRGKVRLPALHIAAKKDDCKAAALLLQNSANPDVTSKSNFTPLHIAAHYGNHEVATLLLDRGADVNFPAKHQITPLHVAAKWGKSHLASLLIERGANIDAKTRDGLTPLHCSARSGHEQLVDVLLEKGAPMSAKTKNGLAALHMSAQGDHVDAARILLYHKAPVDDVTVDYLTALHVAAHCGHVRVAKLLLDRKADPNSRALNGFTPLHIACKKNRIKVVELLLKSGAQIEATTESGLTPLHVASFMGCMNIAIFLLQNGSKPDATTVRGETPLHLAARANQTDIVRILLRNGASVDARAKEEQTPLHIAARLGNCDLVMLLLQHGASADAATKEMYTSLHIAAKEGQEEVAAILLDKGANVAAPTKRGFTPLHLASKHGHVKVANLLLSKGAPVNAAGKNDLTPLHLATHHHQNAVALMLLDNGADAKCVAKNGYTPLHVASKHNQIDIATALIEYGADVNAVSRAGFTPVHLASGEGHADIVTLLIQHGAEADVGSKNGLRPLHLAAQEDRVPAANILVNMGGATVDPATQSGYTPLHVASHFGQAAMVRYLLQNGANVRSVTSAGNTPLHHAAQQGQTLIITLLLEKKADPDSSNTAGQTPLAIAEKLGYVSVVETLKIVTTHTTTKTTTTTIEERYKVLAPESMVENLASDSEDEGTDDAGNESYRYLTVDDMKSLGDDSLPIDVTRDEQHHRDSGYLNLMEENIVQQSYSRNTSAAPATDNVDISRSPIQIGFLVSFMVDARGGAMRGCRHSGVRIIIPPRKAPSPMRITCRYLRKDRLVHPPPLMEGEALASRVLELGPIGVKFLGPVILEVPHFAALRSHEREIIVLRSDNGEAWKEHTLDSSEEALNDVFNESFDSNEMKQLDEFKTNRITRIVTHDFPQYFALVSRIRQEVHAVGPEGGMVSSSVVPQVQAVFPSGALTKRIKVGLQAHPISTDLINKVVGSRVSVSPIVTVEPRRRKFHKPITLSIPVPKSQDPNSSLRLLCSITGVFRKRSVKGGTTRAQWEDVTGSTPLTFVNDCVSFTTTVSARFWLVDCRHASYDVTRMATELYREAIHVPFMAKFVIFAKRIEANEARLRVFCMTDDREEKTLEGQENFTEVAKSRDVEVLEGKPQWIEMAGNLAPVTKSGEQLRLKFYAFRENRLPFLVRLRDVGAGAVGRIMFMRESRSSGKNDQTPVCNLNIVLPEELLPDDPSAPASMASSPRQVHNNRYNAKSIVYSALPKYLTPSEGEIHKADLRISDVANLLGDDWIPLSHHLGIADQDVSIIETEYPDSPYQQATVMLRLWMQQSGDRASGNNLEKALNAINRGDIVSKCIGNLAPVTDVSEKLIAQTHVKESKTSGDIIDPVAVKTEKKILSLEPSYDEPDIMKDSESLEDISQLESARNKAKLELEKNSQMTTSYEREEQKYVAEEKEKTGPNKLRLVTWKLDNETPSVSKSEDSAEVKVIEVKAVERSETDSPMSMSMSMSASTLDNCDTGISLTLLQDMEGIHSDTEGEVSELSLTLASPIKMPEGILIAGSEGEGESSDSDTVKPDVPSTSHSIVEELHLDESFTEAPSATQYVDKASSPVRILDSEETKKGQGIDVSVGTEPKDARSQYVLTNLHDIVTLPLGDSEIYHILQNTAHPKESRDLDEKDEILSPISVQDEPSPVVGTKITEIIQTSREDSTVVSVKKTSEKEETTISGRKSSEKQDVVPTKKSPEKPTAILTKKSLEKQDSKKSPEKPTPISTRQSPEKPVATPTRKIPEKPTSISTRKSPEKPTTISTKKSPEKPAPISKKSPEKPVSTKKSPEKPVSTPTKKSTEKPVTVSAKKSPEKPVSTAAIATKSPEKPVSTAAILTKSPEKPVSTAISAKTPEKPVSAVISTKSPEKPVSASISTKSPEKPVATTAISTKSPEKPVATTAISTKSPEKPVATTAISTKSPEKPVATTAISTKSPEKPVATTAISTESPEKPVATTAVSTKSPEEPVATTAISNKSTEKPVAATAISTKSPEKPVPTTAISTKSPEKPYSAKSPEKPTTISPKKIPEAESPATEVVETASQIIRRLESVTKLTEAKSIESTEETKISEKKPASKTPSPKSPETPKPTTPPKDSKPKVISHETVTKSVEIDSKSAAAISQTVVTEKTEKSLETVTQSISEVSGTKKSTEESEIEKLEKIETIRTKPVSPPQEIELEKSKPDVPAASVSAKIIPQEPSFESPDVSEATVCSILEDQDSLDISSPKSDDLTDTDKTVLTERSEQQTVLSGGSKSESPVSAQLESAILSPDSKIKAVEIEPISVEATPAKPLATPEPQRTERSQMQMRISSFEEKLTSQEIQSPKRSVTKDKSQEVPSDRPAIISQSTKSVSQLKARFESQTSQDEKSKSEISKEIETKLVPEDKPSSTVAKKSPVVAKPYQIVDSPEASLKLSPAKSIESQDITEIKISSATEQKSEIVAQSVSHVKSEVESTHKIVTESKIESVSKKPEFEVEPGQELKPTATSEISEQKIEPESQKLGESVESEEISASLIAESEDAAPKYELTGYSNLGFSETDDDKTYTEDVKKPEVETKTQVSIKSETRSAETGSTSDSSAVQKLEEVVETSSQRVYRMEYEVIKSPKKPTDASEHKDKDLTNTAKPAQTVDDTKSQEQIFQHAKAEISEEKIATSVDISHVAPAAATIDQKLKPEVTSTKIGDLTDSEKIALTARPEEKALTEATTVISQSVSRTITEKVVSTEPESRVTETAAAPKEAAKDTEIPSRISDDSNLDKAAPAAAISVKEKVEKIEIVTKDSERTTDSKDILTKISPDSTVTKDTSISVATVKEKVEVEIKPTKIEAVPSDDGVRVKDVKEVSPESAVTQETSTTEVKVTEKAEKDEMKATEIEAVSTSAEKIKDSKEISRKISEDSTANQPKLKEKVEKIETAIIDAEKIKDSKDIPSKTALELITSQDTPVSAVTIQEKVEKVEIKSTKIETETIDEATGKKSEVISRTISPDSAPVLQTHPSQSFVTEKVEKIEALAKEADKVKNSTSEATAQEKVEKAVETKPTKIETAPSGDAATVKESEDISLTISADFAASQVTVTETDKKLEASIIDVEKTRDSKDIPSKISLESTVAEDKSSSVVTVQEKAEKTEAKSTRIESVPVPGDDGAKIKDSKISHRIPDDSFQATDTDKMDKIETVESKDSAKILPESTVSQDAPISGTSVEEKAAKAETKVIKMEAGKAQDGAQIKDSEDFLSTISKESTEFTVTEKVEKVDDLSKGEEIEDSKDIPAKISLESAVTPKSPISQVKAEKEDYSIKIEAAPIDEEAKVKDSDKISEESASTQKTVTSKVTVTKKEEKIEKLADSQKLKDSKDVLTKTSFEPTEVQATSVFDASLQEKAEKAESKVTMSRTISGDFAGTQQALSSQVTVIEKVEKIEKAIRDLEKSEEVEETTTKIEADKPSSSDVNLQEKLEKAEIKTSKIEAVPSDDVAAAKDSEEITRKISEDSKAAQQISSDSQITVVEKVEKIEAVTKDAEQVKASKDKTVLEPAAVQIQDTLISDVSGQEKVEKSTKIETAPSDDVTKVKDSEAIIARTIPEDSFTQQAPSVQVSVTEKVEKIEIQTSKTEAVSSHQQEDDLKSITSKISDKILTKETTEAKGVEKAELIEPKASEAHVTSVSTKSGVSKHISSSTTVIEKKEIDASAAAAVPLESESHEDSKPISTKILAEFQHKLFPEVVTHEKVEKTKTKTSQISPEPHAIEAVPKAETLASKIEASPKEAEKEVSKPEILPVKPAPKEAEDISGKGKTSIESIEPQVKLSPEPATSEKVEQIQIESSTSEVSSKETDKVVVTKDISSSMVSQSASVRDVSSSEVAVKEKVEETKIETPAFPEQQLAAADKTGKLVIKSSEIEAESKIRDAKQVSSKLSDESHAAQLSPEKVVTEKPEETKIHAEISHTEAAAVSRIEKHIEVDSSKSATVASHLVEHETVSDVDTKTAKPDEVDKKSDLKEKVEETKIQTPAFPEQQLAAADKTGKLVIKSSEIEPESKVKDTKQVSSKLSDESHAAQLSPEKVVAEKPEETKIHAEISHKEAAIVSRIEKHIEVDSSKSATVASHLVEHEAVSESDIASKTVKPDEADKKSDLKESTVTTEILTATASKDLPTGEPIQSEASGVAGFETKTDKEAVIMSQTQAPSSPASRTVTHVTFESSETSSRTEETEAPRKIFRISPEKARVKFPSDDKLVKVVQSRLAPEEHAVSSLEHTETMPQSISSVTVQPEGHEIFQSTTTETSEVLKLSTVKPLSPKAKVADTHMQFQESSSSTSSESRTETRSQEILQAKSMESKIGEQSSEKKQTEAIIPEKSEEIGKIAYAKVTTFVEQKEIDSKIPDSKVKTPEKLKEPQEIPDAKLETFAEIHKEAPIERTESKIEAKISDAEGIHDAKTPSTPIVKKFATSLQEIQQDVSIESEGAELRATDSEEVLSPVDLIEGAIPEVELEISGLGSKQQSPTEQAKPADAKSPDAKASDAGTSDATVKSSVSEIHKPETEAKTSESFVQKIEEPASGEIPISIEKEIRTESEIFDTKSESIQEPKDVEQQKPEALIHGIQKPKESETVLHQIQQPQAESKISIEKLATSVPQIHEQTSALTNIQQIESRPHLQVSESEIISIKDSKESTDVVDHRLSEETQSQEIMGKTTEASESDSKSESTIHEDSPISVTTVKSTVSRIGVHALPLKETHIDQITSPSEEAPLTPDLTPRVSPLIEIPGTFVLKPALKRSESEGLPEPTRIAYKIQRGTSEVYTEELSKSLSFEKLGGGLSPTFKKWEAHEIAEFESQIEESGDGAEFVTSTSSASVSTSGSTIRSEIHELSPIRDAEGLSTILEEQTQETASRVSKVSESSTSSVSSEPPMPVPVEGQRTVQEVIVKERFAVVKSAAELQDPAEYNRMLCQGIITESADTTELQFELEETESEKESFEQDIPSELTKKSPQKLETSQAAKEKLDITETFSSGELEAIEEQILVKSSAERSKVTETAYSKSEFTSGELEALEDQIIEESRDTKQTTQRSESESEFILEEAKAELLAAISKLEDTFEPSAPTLETFEDEAEVGQEISKIATPPLAEDSGSEHEPSPETDLKTEHQFEDSDKFKKTSVTVFQSKRHHSLFSVDDTNERSDTMLRSKSAPAMIASELIIPPLDINFSVDGQTSEFRSSDFGPGKSTSFHDESGLTLPEEPSTKTTSSTSDSPLSSGSRQSSSVGSGSQFSSIKFSSSTTTQSSAQSSVPDTPCSFQIQSQSGSQSGSQYSASSSYTRSHSNSESSPGLGSLSSCHSHSKSSSSSTTEGSTEDQGLSARDLVSHSSEDNPTIVEIIMPIINFNFVVGEFDTEAHSPTVENSKILSGFLGRSSAEPLGTEHGGSGSPVHGEVKLVVRSSVNGGGFVEITSLREGVVTTPSPAPSPVQGSQSPESPLEEASVMTQKLVVRFHGASPDMTASRSSPAETTCTQTLTKKTVRMVQLPSADSEETCSELPMSGSYTFSEIPRRKEDIEKEALILDDFERQAELDLATELENANQTVSSLPPAPLEKSEVEGSEKYWERREVTQTFSTAEAKDAATRLVGEIESNVQQRLGMVVTPSVPSSVEITDEELLSTGDVSSPEYFKPVKASTTTKASMDCETPEGLIGVSSSSSEFFTAREDNTLKSSSDDTRPKSWDSSLLCQFPSSGSGSEYQTAVNPSSSQSSSRSYLGNLSSASGSGTLVASQIDLDSCMDEEDEAEPPGEVPAPPPPQPTSRSIQVGGESPNLLETRLPVTLTSSASGTTVCTQVETTYEARVQGEPEMDDQDGNTEIYDEAELANLFQSKNSSMSVESPDGMERPLTPEPPRLLFNEASQLEELFNTEYCTTGSLPYSEPLHKLEDIEEEGSLKNSPKSVLSLEMSGTSLESNGERQLGRPVSRESSSSLNEFERLESALLEEDSKKDPLLSEIEEGHESQVSEGSDETEICGEEPVECEMEFDWDAENVARPEQSSESPHFTTH